MRISKLIVPCHGLLLALIFGTATIPAARAVIAPSTFSPTLQVQGEEPGTEFDDWAGIPIAWTDPQDAIFGTDVKDIQIANNNELIFIRATLYNTEPTDLNNLFLAFDTDQNPATGFNVNAIGIGSDVGYQADFPFQQSATAFNTGVEGVVEFGGDFIGLGLIYPFINFPDPFNGTQLEWSIPIDLAIGPTAPGTTVFTSNTFNFSLYYSGLFVDVVEEIFTYTLAADPNPGTPGDFDNDGDVDGVDFLKWQRGESPEPLSATDLALWQDNYGGGGELAAVTAVPEPGTIILSAAGLAFAGALRRRGN